MLQVAGRLPSLQLQHTSCRLLRRQCRSRCRCYRPRHQQDRPQGQCLVLVRQRGASVQQNQSPGCFRCRRGSAGRSGREHPHSEQKKGDFSGKKVKTRGVKKKQTWNLRRRAVWMSCCGDAAWRVCGGQCTPPCGVMRPVLRSRSSPPCTSARESALAALPLAPFALSRAPASRSPAAAAASDTDGLLKCL